MAQRPLCVLSRLLFSCSVFGALITGLAASAAPDEPRAALTGHRVPAAAAHLIGRVEATRPITLTFVLPLRDQAGLSDLLTRLYRPGDPMYHHFLSVPEFTDKFGPSVSDVNAVAQYARSQGLSVSEIAPNRVLVRVTGPSAAAETALGVHFNDYQKADGTRFRAPDREPTFPRSIASRMLDVVGTDDLPYARPFLHRVQPAQAEAVDALADAGLAQPRVAGTGHYEDLAPSDIGTIYGLSSLPETGSGQVLALYELDGYTASDITTYESYYGLPNVPLQNVLLDGFNGRPTPVAMSGSSEDTLDIDMVLAAAPGLSKIIVYEADNTTQGSIVEYNRIASDNLASIVSTSWGSDEGTANSSYASGYGNLVTDEQNELQQMAAQGQSNFAAAGDQGAYDNGSTLSVDDPGSQQYMCDVGGTNLNITSSLEYISESAWGDKSSMSGGGGGISTLWSIPSYQSGVTGAAGSQVSTTMRNVPDVALYGDYLTGGYDVFYTDPTMPTQPAADKWTGFNGTSADAPLWAGFMARVNQARAAKGLTRIGFPNPLIYATAKDSVKYANDFHDVEDGTTNLYYPATVGYDLTTGWGSFKAAALLPDLSASSVTWSAGDVAAAADGTARLLWKRSDGAASLWNLNASNVETNKGPTYGPYTDNDGSWSALGVAVAPDGTSRILWTRSDGAAGVWTINTVDAQTGVGPTYGPYEGWKAADIAVSGTGTRILWTRSDGAAGVWTMNANGVQTSVGPTYGPYSGWTATGVSAAPDGTARILWTNSNGKAGLWVMSANNSQAIIGPTYGPYSGWKAIDVGTASNGYSTVLWRNTNGTAGLWTFNTSGVETVEGTVYGPYTGFTAAQSDCSLTGTTRVLWVGSNRTAGLWSMDGNGTANVIGTTYGPY